MRLERECSCWNKHVKAIVTLYDIILYFDDTLFREELKENGSFWVKIKCKYFEQEAPRVRVGSLGSFSSSSEIF